MTSEKVRERRARGLGTVFAPAALVMLAGTMSGCAGTAGGAGAVPKAPPAAAAAQYATIDQEQARSDMTKIAGCAKARGIVVRPDVVNGGFSYASGQSNSASSILRTCSQDIYGNPETMHPARSDANQVYGLYLAQAACLRKAGFAVGEPPDAATFTRAFQKSGSAMWSPLYANDGALSKWAARRKLSEKAAYAAVLTKCPDPLRMWKYMDHAAQRK